MATIEYAQLDLLWKVGDGFPIVATVKDDTGATVDLTGAHATYALAADPATITKDSANVGEITINTATSQVSVNLLSADTAGITPGEYDHQLRIKLSNGDVHCLFEGTFTFVAAIAATPS